MKKLFVLFLMLFSINVQALDCTNMELLARNIMINRQAGISMSKMIEVSKDYELGKAIIQDAYEIPRYTSEEVRNQVIEDFANDMYLMCYKLIENPDDTIIIDGTKVE